MRRIMSFFIIVWFLNSCAGNCFDNKGDLANHIFNESYGVSKSTIMDDGTSLSGTFLPDILLPEIKRSGIDPDSCLLFVLSISRNGQELLPQLNSYDYTTIMRV